MKISYFPLLATLALFPLPLLGAKIKPTAVPPAPAPLSAPAIEMPAGEKTVLSVTYAGAEGGTITLTAGAPAAGPNGATREFCLQARTESFFSLFYRVKNSYCSNVRLGPWRTERFLEELDESKQSGRTVQDFVAAKGRARVTEDMHHKEKGDSRTESTIQIPPGTQDVISAVFYVRSAPLSLGKTFSVPVLIGRDVKELRFTVKEETELPTKIGKLPAWVVELTPLTGKETGKTNTLWIGKEGAQPLLKLKADVKLGSVIAYLKSYEPGSR